MMKAPLFGIRSVLPLYAHVEELRRRGKGAYENGRWIAQDDEELKFKASVQTAIDKDLEDVDEGRRVNGGIKIYTSTKLQAACVKDKLQPDIIEWGGNSFLVEKVSDWSKDGGYYKVIASRVNV